MNHTDPPDDTASNTAGITGRRVLVCGGRDYADTQTVIAVLDSLGIVELCHGAATGADSIAARYAAARGIPIRAFPAEWRWHGKSAGPRRNAAMLAEFAPDLVVAFPGGRGTANMVALADAAGVDVIQVTTAENSADVSLAWHVPGDAS